MPVSPDARPLQVPALALRELSVGDGLKRELDCVVAVDVRGAHLDDRARACLDDRDRRHAPRLGVEDLGHSDFATKYAFHDRAPQSVAKSVEI